MALEAGRHLFGTERGRIVLRTFRDGLASQAGHDLTIEAGRWSGELTVTETLDPAGLEIRIEMGSLIVREGTGGLKPLTDRDRREIAVTARRVLLADRHPDATFSATTFAPAAGGGGVISGSLTLASVTRPVQLQVSEPGPGHYLATTSVRQSDHGIKPYTAFFGALRVRDAVDVEIDIDLQEEPAGPEAQA
ncbi:MAG: YceI family protein [Streptosporangiaceae bacterium]|jgi:polyisoprenoid-binding protein YceI